MCVCVFVCLFVGCSDFCPVISVSFPQGLRAQIDRDVFRQRMQEAVRGVAGLAIREDSVEDLVLTETQDGGQSKVDGVCLGTITALRI